MYPFGDENVFWVVMLRVWAPLYVLLFPWPPLDQACVSVSGVCAEEALCG